MSAKAIGKFLPAFWITFVLIGIVAAAVLLAKHNDDRRAEDLIKNEQRYGVKLKDFQYTDCLNGWVIIQNTTHSWLYARDDEFKPIRCDQ